MTRFDRRSCCDVFLVLMCCRLVASSPLPSSNGLGSSMSADHPSVQQAFSVLKDHLEAIEKLQAQLKRCVCVCVCVCVCALVLPVC
jgi:hypothetical protein